MDSTRTLEMKHIADLLDMHFNIPNFQRGYRWESKHVKELLNDLYSFSVQMSETQNNQGKFYCMQPLSVVKNNRLSTDGKTVYDIIDGQQRLTTLYLLLSYLSDTRKVVCSGKLATSVFSLQYENRESEFFDNEKFKSSDIREAMDNIDFFYMTRAYKTIENWFENNSINRNKILKILIPENYCCLSGLEETELQKTKLKNDKENDIRFIWYEVPAENNTESIEVFSHLNYGKTALTATELVKALLFQCDIYNTDTSLMGEIAFRRSCEWDLMEKQLQNPFMWSMFMSDDKNIPSHITVVLQLVANKLYAQILTDNPNIHFSPDSNDFIYQVCNKYLGTNKEGDYAEKTKQLWEEIQQTYTAMYNWYENSDTYHLIGLLIWLKEYKTSDFDNGKRFIFLQQLMNEYCKKSKDEFIEYLKKEIAKIIHIKEPRQTAEGEIRWGLEHINYNNNPLDIVRILILFNVEDIRNRQDESARFPFHLLRKYNITSIEHIHPQHLVLDNIKFDNLRTWLNIKERNLKRTEAFIDNADIICDLKNYIKDENSYKANKNEIQQIINKFDREFDELVGMDETQMHTLYNLALVDKDTNSALSNNLLDTKREILRKREEEKATYVLPATEKVFSKYYSHVQNSDISPKYWTKNDRQDYFYAIEKVYKDFDSYYKKD